MIDVCAVSGDVGVYRYYNLGVAAEWVVDFLLCYSFVLLVFTVVYTPPVVIFVCCRIPTSQCVEGYWISESVWNGP